MFDIAVFVDKAKTHVTTPNAAAGAGGASSKQQQQQQQQQKPKTGRLSIFFNALSAPKDAPIPTTPPATNGEASNAAANHSSHSGGATLTGTGMTLDRADGEGDADGGEAGSMDDIYGDDTAAVNNSWFKNMYASPSTSGKGDHFKGENAMIKNGARSSSSTSPVKPSITNASPRTGSGNIRAIGLPFLIARSQSGKANQVHKDGGDGDGTEEVVAMPTNVVKYAASMNELQRLAEETEFSDDDDDDDADDDEDGDDDKDGDDDNSDEGAKKTKDKEHRKSHNKTAAAAGATRTADGAKEKGKVFRTASKIFFG